MKLTTQREKKSLSNQARIAVEHQRMFFQLKDIEDWMAKHSTIFPPEGRISINRESLLTYPFPLTGNNSTLKRLQQGVGCLQTKLTTLDYVISRESTNSQN